MTKFNVTLFTSFILLIVLLIVFFTPPEPIISIGGDSEIGVISIGEDNTMIIKQIFDKSDEYGELKKALSEINQEIAIKAAQCQEMRVDKLPEKYISRCILDLNSLNNKKDSISEIEKKFREDVIRLAKTFSKTSINSERLRTAKTLFKNGKIHEADAVLKVPEMETETEDLLLQKQSLIKEYDSLLNIKAFEWLIKAEITKTRYDLVDWFDSTSYYFLRSIQCRAGSENQYAYAQFLETHNNYDTAVAYYKLTNEICLLTDDKECQAVIQKSLGNIYRRQSAYDEAQSALFKALDIYQQLAEDNHQRFTSGLASTQHNLGVMYYDLRDYDKAEAYFLKADTLWNHLVKTNAQRFETDLAMTQISIGNVLMTQNAYKRSEVAYKKALTTYSRLAERDSLRFDPYLAMVYNNLGILYRRSEEYQKAEEVLRKALKVRQKLALLNPKRFEPSVAITLQNLGNAYTYLDSFNEAEAVILEAIEIRKRLASEDPERYVPLVADLQLNLGYLYQRQKNYQESEASYFQALKTFKRLMKDNYDRFKPDVADAYGNLSAMYLFKKQFKEAEEMANLGIGTDSDQYWISSNLALALLFQGKYQDAVQVYLQYKNKEFYNGLNGTEMFLDGIKETEEAGITHPDLEKFKQLLQK